MKKLLASILCAALVNTLAPISLVAQNTGEIAGTAVVEGKPLPNITVRLRNVDNGQLVGNMRTNERGEFRFTGLPAGNFVVETGAPNGALLGTSTRITLVAGAMAASVAVTTSAAAAAAAGVGGAAAAGAAGAGAAAGGGAAAGAAAAGGAGFFATTAGIVTVAAVGAGVAAAAVAATGDASPSQSA